MYKEDGSVQEPAPTVEPIELTSPDGEITLRQYTIDDAAEVFAIINRNREHLSQNHEDTADKYPTLQVMEESILHPKNPERRRFAIRNRQDVIVGGINLTTDDEKPEEAEIGYWQGKEFTGKGYTGRAVETLTAFGFENLGYKTIYGKVFETNEPSVKVLQRAGYIQTGKNDGYIRLEKSTPRK